MRGEGAALLAPCRACPRACGSDRLADDRSGVCRTGRWARVCSAFPHQGEEACLRGRRGSGTIFFARCNLRCVFCQNADISQGAGGSYASAGEELDAEALARLMLRLQGAGCHNVNLVSPSHLAVQIVEALALARAAGLELPVVYNSGGYDSVEALELLEGWIDVYMPDFKLWERAESERLLGASDYPERARAALQEMQRQVGPLSFDSEGLAARGLMVRHLVLPGLVEQSLAILRWLAELSPQTYVNVMGQYHPAHEVSWRDGAEGAYAEIARLPTQGEVEEVRREARRLGLRLDGETERRA